MTSYKGHTISYDAVGNPLSYFNGGTYNLTWSDGRRLIGATRGSNNYSFTYNDEGIRTSKTVNGVKHTYVLDGSRIVSQQWSDKLIIYLYDETGSPIGMQYRTSSYAQGVFDTYYFEKNLQGDIIAVYSASGTVLVYYKYDAWGNFTYTFCNNGSSTPVVYNPFRYRGYYYDADLGLYYLNSRYYDSNTGRFINPDDYTVIGATPMALTDKNLYAYCDNNPIMRTDGDGDFWNWFVGGVVGAIGGAVSAAIEGKKGNEFWGSVANSAVSGAIAGLTVDALVVTGGSAAIVIAACAFGGAAGNAVGCITEDLIVDGNVCWSDVGKTATVGAVTGSIYGAVLGPQTKMMDEVISRAGKKALDRGITIGYAVRKTMKREFNKLRGSFIEEGLSNFTFGLFSEVFEEMVGW